MHPSHIRSNTNYTSTPPLKCIRLPLPAIKLNLEKNALKQCMVTLLQPKEWQLLPTITASIGLPVPFQFFRPSIPFHSFLVLNSSVGIFKEPHKVHNSLVLESLCYSLSHPLISPGDSDGEESACNSGDPGSFPGLGRSPGGGHGYPLQYSCLENSHGQRSLAGSSPWGHKELGTTEVTKHSMCTHTHTHTHTESICILYIYKYTHTTQSLYT